MLAASAAPALGLLHVRGGVSTPGLSFRQHQVSSPRPWRCFSISLLVFSFSSVFSTSVEVFLHADEIRAGTRSLLHVRGGVSSPRENG